MCMLTATTLDLELLICSEDLFFYCIILSALNTGFRMGGFFHGFLFLIEKRNDRRLSPFFCSHRDCITLKDFSLSFLYILRFICNVLFFLMVAYLI